MAKKKEKKVVAVKKLKIGERYLFEFAGSRLIGTLTEHCKELEEHYKEPWFTIVVEKGSQAHPRTMRYPVSIYGIIRKAKPGEIYTER
jgi:hypothetical protein